MAMSPLQLTLTKEFLNNWISMLTKNVNTVIRPNHTLIQEHNFFGNIASQI
jgi:arsenate reductase-like glutaredoxin family protein